VRAQPNTKVVRFRVVELESVSRLPALVAKECDAVFYEKLLL